MNILIIGDDVNFKECRQKFGEAHSYSLKQDPKESELLFEKQDVIFDFCMDRDRSQLAAYKDHPNIIAFLNTAKMNLAQLSASINNNISGTLFGFAGLPTFLDRPILETSLYKEDQKSKLEDVCNKLKTEFQIVKDRVGLVTPRVICMIINEAYFTLEEGTATREDIDLAMKLGTNYPYEIGRAHV